MRERFIDTVPELAPLLDGADHLDVKTVQTNIGLREFVCAMLLWRPWWATALYRLRGVVARALRLEHSAEEEYVFTPQTLPMAPGEDVGFFSLRMAREDAFYVLEAEDNHLGAFLIAAREPAPGGSIFHVCTIVHYRNWKGPVYFNLIRPFHHLIVARMARAGAGG